MIRLYDTALSGNSHKVRILLSFLKLDYEQVPVNLIEGEQKTATFLKLNGLAQVPLLTDGSAVIRDSQAILVYLARQYGGETWLPTDPVGMSQVIQWLSTAANEIANGLAAARVFHFLGRKSVDIERATAGSYGILAVLEQHLSDRQWLECGRPTIADVACFPYVALAHQGQIELTAYPAVIGWAERFKQLPGFVTMPGM